MKENILQVGFGSCHSDILLSNQLVYTETSVTLALESTFFFPGGGGCSVNNGPDEAIDRKIGTIISGIILNYRRNQQKSLSNRKYSFTIEERISRSFQQSLQRQRFNEM